MYEIFFFFFSRTSSPLISRTNTGNDKRENKQVALGEESK